MDINLNKGDYLNNHPLISFKSVIDEDASIIKYLILTESNIINFDYIKEFGSLFAILSKLYNRKIENPIILFKKDDITVEEADKLYKELLESEEYLEDYSISTEIFNLVDIMSSENGLTPTILCYTDKQKELIKENFDSINIVMADNLIMSVYDTIMVKYISELSIFKNIFNKQIYFSDCGINLSDKNINEKYNNIIDELSIKHNLISIYNMYKPDLVKTYYDDKGE